MSTAASTSDSDPDDDGEPSEATRGRPAPPCEFDPERILFHGDGLVAIDKPAGIPVHCGTDHDVGVAELVEQWISLNPGVIESRPGKKVHPVHRLDLEASGALVLALKRTVARRAQDAFSARTVEKRYLAVIAGPVDREGVLEGEVRSRLRGQYRRLPARVRYRRLRHDERMSLVEVVPEGGRTHQIRAVLAQSGRPLAGDLRYGKPKPARQFLERFGVAGLILHAHRLVLPATVIGRRLVLEATLPEALASVCEQKGWAGLARDPRGEWIAAG